MDGDDIAKKARRSISEYCINECRAYCCRKGYLILEEKEVDIICQDKKQLMIEKGVLVKNKEGKYSLDLSSTDMNCPSLDMDTFYCKIHLKRLRPKACKEFPIFIEGENLRLSSRCPAIKEGKLYLYIHKLIKMGYKLQKNPWYANLEIYKFIPKQ